MSSSAGGGAGGHGGSSSSGVPRPQGEGGRHPQHQQQEQALVVPSFSFSSSLSWTWACSSLGIRPDGAWSATDRASAVFASLNLRAIQDSPYLTFTKIKQLLVHVRQVFGQGGVIAPSSATGSEGSPLYLPTALSVGAGGSGGEGSSADSWVEILVEDPSCWATPPCIAMRAMISRRAFLEFPSLKAGATVLLRSVSVFCTGPCLKGGSSSRLAGVIGGGAGRGGSILQGVVTKGADGTKTAHIALVGGGGGLRGAAAVATKYLTVPSSSVIAVWAAEGPVGAPGASQLATEAALLASSASLELGRSRDQAADEASERQRLGQLSLLEKKAIYNPCISS